jgi:hypothetical protein
MLAESPELLIRPLKTNVGYERLFRPIRLPPQTTGTYLGFSKFGRSIGGDFPTRLVEFCVEDFRKRAKELVAQEAGQNCKRAERVETKKQPQTECQRSGAANL